VGAWVDASRRLLIQSSVDVEALIQRDLAAGLAVAIEAAAINGTSTSSQPTGILNTSGIGTSTGGANGAAPTWANIVALESELGIDNADIGALAYLTNARVRGKLKQTTKSTSAVTGFVWDDGEFPLNGYRAAVTSNVPSNITKGTTTGSLSAIIFGNFSDLLLGFWGNGIDILVDPYTGSSAGTVRIRSLADVDVAVRHAESFAAMPDALTT
jgi:HK97 family phage major capsid protein